MPEVIRTDRFVMDAVGLIVEAAELALRERDVFRIALSGGNTPRPVYAELSRCNLPWNSVSTPKWMSVMKPSVRSGIAFDRITAVATSVVEPGQPA